MLNAGQVVRARRLGSSSGQYNLTPGLRCGESFSNKVEPVLTLSNCVINAGPVWGSNVEGWHCVIELCAAIGLNTRLGLRGSVKKRTGRESAPTRTAFAHEGASSKYLVSTKRIHGCNPRFPDSTCAVEWHATYSTVGQRGCVHFSQLDGNCNLLPVWWGGSDAARRVPALYNQRGTHKYIAHAISDLTYRWTLQACTPCPVRGQPARVKQQRGRATFFRRGLPHAHAD